MYQHLDQHPLLVHHEALFLPFLSPSLFFLGDVPFVCVILQSASGFLLRSERLVSFHNRRHV